MRCAALLLMLVTGAATDSECKAPDGRDGLLGMKGSPGRNGRQGEKGDRGEPAGLPPSIGSGQPGLKGRQGDPGKAGIPGIKGYAGLPGLLGESGAAGEKGRKGQSGEGGGLHGSERPAFSVAKVTSHPPSPKSSVKFTKVITNEGGCFRVNTGQFVCCKSGWYYFTYNAVAVGDLCVQIKVSHHPDTKGHTIASFCDTSSSSQNKYQMNSGGTVLHLSELDKVWLQVKENKNKMYGSEERNSVFSGFLLFPDE
ncbi:complement C1q subcomponent subunit A isoform X1 [Callorhinchus milii]|uniref:Complement C1q subcomponent subunit A n=1 Tax=Callorhinchus milii TaxID=7868 RepID=V9L9R4_CALMI|nr:complement C1q subcomponent subunit A isoform X1 [Callorhinchus milii]